MEINNLHIINQALATLIRIREDCESAMVRCDELRQELDESLDKLYKMKEKQNENTN